MIVWAVDYQAVGSVGVGLEMELELGDLEWSSLVNEAGDTSSPWGLTGIPIDVSLSGGFLVMICQIHLSNWFFPPLQRSRRRLWFANILPHNCLANAAEGTGIPERGEQEAEEAWL